MAENALIKGASPFQGTTIRAGLIYMEALALIIPTEIEWIKFHNYLDSISNSLAIQN